MVKKGENKTKLVSARVTEAEYNVLKKKADEQGVTISQVIIGATVKSNTISALMTRNTVSLIKSISAECKELRADYNLLRQDIFASDLYRSMSALSPSSYNEMTRGLIIL